MLPVEWSMWAHTFRMSAAQLNEPTTRRESGQMEVTNKATVVGRLSEP